MLYEGSDKTRLNRRYNAPHLNSMELYAQTVHSHIAIQEVSAVRKSISR